MRFPYGAAQVAPSAWRYAGAVAVLGLVAFPFSGVATAAGIVAALFVLWFHRDPDRQAPDEGIVSPADGRVQVIREEDDRLRVGVFMNVHNVHVNRAPLHGQVVSVEHSPGAHRPAFTKESERNERVRIGLEDHEIVLIAGAFARRITTYVGEGEHVGRGDRIGHISFGSRADVILPPGIGRTNLAVGTGDRVRAGESVIARE